MTANIRVFVVNGRSDERESLERLIHDAPTLELVGSSGDAFEARDQLRERDVDVLLLAVELPRMDGVAFLKSLLRWKPLPTVLTCRAEEAEAAVVGLELGAVDVALLDQLVPTRLEDQLFRAAGANVGARVERLARENRETLRGPRIQKAARRLCVVAGSQGALDALGEVARTWRPTFPASCLLLVTPLPPPVLDAWTRRLSESCARPVTPARDDQRIDAGHIYVAPGQTRLTCSRHGAASFFGVGDPALASFSFDALMGSVATSFGQDSAAAWVGGAGRDGLWGLGKLRACGAHTVVTTPNTTMCATLATLAIRLGVTCEVVELDALHEHLERQLAFGPTLTPTPNPPLNKPTP